MIQNFTDVVILAGGIGERLWPASSPENPKQFIDLGDGISFLQASIQRALALNIGGKILVITRYNLVDKVSKECWNLAQKCNESERKKILEDLYIIAEPCPRHTCAPLLLAAKFLKLTDSSFTHIILTLASDHIIGPKDRFINDCQKAAQAAGENSFVCFAIPPTEAATGYGYIKKGEVFKSDSSVFKIEMFKEKPDAKTALLYLQSKQYYWNSGMFAFTADFFEREVEKCQNDVYKSFENLSLAGLTVTKSIDNIKVIDKWKEMKESYSKTPAIAVDNAIAEKTDKAVAVMTTFDWDDVGSWDSFEKHTKGSVNHVSLESENNFVYSDIPVALCGVTDLVVVIKNGKALVMKKGKSSLMRELVKKMSENNKPL